MFDHFTFGAASQVAQQEEILSPSPTDTSYASTPQSPQFPSTYLLGENEEGFAPISDKFSAHSLSCDALVQDFANWGNDSSSFPSGLAVDDSNEEMPDTYFTHTHNGYASSAPISPIDGGIACRRLQRQLNVQMQTSSSHMRDINALVEDMIASSSQCCLHTTSSLSRSYPSLLEVDTDLSVFDEERQEDIDEGFHEDESLGEDYGFALRRASTPSGIRKFNGVNGFGWSRSRDVLCVNGRAKVKCKPRMRRRRKTPTPTINEQ